MTVENEAVVVFISVGIVAVDFHDLGNKAAARASLQVNDNVYGIAHVVFDRAKANVRPATTIATSESPRAMVLVNASCSTFTAFSHGEFPWAKSGAASRRPAATLAATRTKPTKK
jgi:hypothetical protein